MFNHFLLARWKALSKDAGGTLRSTLKRTHFSETLPNISCYQLALKVIGICRPGSFWSLTSVFNEVEQTKVVDIQGGSQKCWSARRDREFVMKEPKMSARDVLCELVFKDDVVIKLCVRLCVQA